MSYILKHKNMYCSLNKKDYNIFKNISTHICRYKIAKDDISFYENCETVGKLLKNMDNYRSNLDYVSNFESKEKHTYREDLILLLSRCKLSKFIEKFVPNNDEDDIFYYGFHNIFREVGIDGKNLKFYVLHDYYKKSRSDDYRDIVINKYNVRKINRNNAIGTKGRVINTKSSFDNKIGLIISMEFPGTPRITRYCLKFENNDVRCFFLNNINILD